MFEVHIRYVGLCKQYLHAVSNALVQRESKQSFQGMSKGLQILYQMQSGTFYTTFYIKCGVVPRRGRTVTFKLTLGIHFHL